MPESQPKSDRIVTSFVDEAAAGDRLDVFLGQAIEDLTRSHAKRLIKDSKVTVSGVVRKRPSHLVSEGEEITIALPPPPPDRPEPEDIPIDVLFEDSDLLIVNKAAGLVVHPSPGHETGTLVNAVMHRCADFQAGEMLADTGELDDVRPGIVHRLDRDTSGVLVVAKSRIAFNHLSQQAREHTFDRRYLALVRGEFPEDHGVIRASIGRSMSMRGRMAVTSVKSRDAVTRFTVLERFGIASLVELQLETGRTHQIRVHLRFAGRPVLGDPVYGVTDFKTWDVSDNLRDALASLQGQALHARLLGIEHPRTGERMRFEAPPHEDFQRALDLLRSERGTP